MYRSGSESRQHDHTRYSVLVDHEVSPPVVDATNASDRQRSIRRFTVCISIKIWHSQRKVCLLSACAVSYTSRRNQLMIHGSSVPGARRCTDCYGQCQISSKSSQFLALQTSCGTCCNRGSPHLFGLNLKELANLHPASTRFERSLLSVNASQALSRVGLDPRPRTAERLRVHLLSISASRHLALHRVRSRICNIVARHLQRKINRQAMLAASLR